MRFFRAREYFAELHVYVWSSIFAIRSLDVPSVVLSRCISPEKTAERSSFYSPRLSCVHVNAEGVGDARLRDARQESLIRGRSDVLFHPRRQSCRINETCNIIVSKSPSPWLITHSLSVFLCRVLRPLLNRIHWVRDINRFIHSLFRPAFFFFRITGNITVPDYIKRKVMYYTIREFIYYW